MSSAVLKRVKNYGVHGYIPEKRHKGKRRWQGKAEEQRAVYENRRRVQGDYGKRLLKRCGDEQIGPCAPTWTWFQLARQPAKTPILPCRLRVHLHLGRRQLKVSLNLYQHK